MNQKRLAPSKPADPPRVTYQLKTASGDAMKTQGGDQITVRY